MANIGSGTSRVIIDPDGEAATVTNNKLDVNATLVAGATIDIGDVDMFLDGGTAILGGTGDVAAGVLRVTLASNDEHFGEVGTAADIDGTIHGQLRYIADNLRPLPEGHDVTIDNESGAAAVNIQDGGNTITVDGTVAVNTISGFATESKQPSLGTAGSASANVITVQGIASMTPLVVDLGSNNDVTVTNDTAGNLLATVTQASAARTVTGTVTANAGTNLNTSALSTHAKQDTIITHLSEIEGAVETIEAAVDTQMQVDVVAISAQSDGTYIGDIKFGESLPAGSNTIGVVDLGSTDNAVLDAIDTVLDTIKVDTEAIETAVELLDNAIDGSEMQVDIVSAPTLTVSGTVTANLSATDNAVLDNILVDTSAIKTAIQVLDDWDDSNYANVNINLAGSDAPTGGGAESGALRVTIANDSTGVVSIDDNGGAITVDGTVDLGSTATTHLSEIEGAVETIEGAISGSEMQADIVTTVQPVGFSSVAQFTTNIGTSATQLDAQACKHADIMAKVGNAGIVYVGGSSVAATTGIALYPGDVYSVEVTNTNLLYAIAISDNDDLQVVYYA